jgi:hypothetical protein
MRYVKSNLLVGCMALLAVSCSNSNIAQQGNNGISETQSTFSINLNPASCQEKPSYQSEFSENVDSLSGARTIVSNNIPNHLTGEFPNNGNPNIIRPQNQSYSLVLEPKYTGRARPGQGYSFGILLNGVEVDPYTGEFFQGRDGTNREWNINALTSAVNLGTDCNNAHVQPDGKYHYHGTPTAYLQSLNADGTEMVKIGYAADGFPIYYKYGYNDSGELIELTSGYKLKSGNRPGNGRSAPDGPYDGTYFQDYEYDSKLSLLDECNGRFGKTPESENEYYYVFTDNYPSAPMCFMGVPSDDFSHRMGGNPQMGGGPNGNHPPGGAPDPNQLFAEMDRNKDDRLSRDEVRGPLQNDFDRFDTNNDGFLTRDELTNLPPPPQGRRP